MTIKIITTVKTTTTEPCRQLPSDRIELQPTSSGMIFLPKKAELEEKYPNFCEALVKQGIQFRADPVQLDAPLLATLRDKVGVRLEVDNVALAATLLNLDEKDLVFNVGAVRWT